MVSNINRCWGHDWAGLFALIGIAVDITGQVAYIAFIVASIVALLNSYSVSKLAVQLGYAYQWCYQKHKKAKLAD